MITFLVTDGNYCCVGWLLLRSALTLRLYIWFDLIALLPCIYRFDGFTSTFQDKLFKGYDMEIHNQIFYTTMCSCIISLTGKCLHILHLFFIKFPLTVILFLCYLVPFTGLILQNHLIPAVDFMFRHPDCFSDVMILSTVRLTYWSFKLQSCYSLFPKEPIDNIEKIHMSMMDIGGCRASMINRGETKWWQLIVKLSVSLKWNVGKQHCGLLISIFSLPSYALKEMLYDITLWIMDVSYSICCNNCFICCSRLQLQVNSSYPTLSEHLGLSHLLP
jgi:hypothetical protein